LLNKSQKISLYKNDSTKINQNVYFRTFSIWNSGNQAIEPSDIRKVVTIKFNGINEILDCTVIKQVDPEISKFALVQDSPSSFKLNWMHFDPKDGLKFQLIYIGNPEIKPEIEGNLLKTDFKLFILVKDNKTAIPLLIFGTAMLIFLTYLFLKILKNKPITPTFISKNSTTVNKLENTIIGKAFKVFIVVAFLIYSVIVPFFCYKFFFQFNAFPF
jgi:hypothetical protein